MSSFVNTNSDEYEKKIAHLIRNAAKRARQQNPGDFANWLDAIRELKKEDHLSGACRVRTKCTAAMARFCAISNVLRCLNKSPRRNGRRWRQNHPASRLSIAAATVRSFEGFTSTTSQNVSNLSQVQELCMHGGWGFICLLD